MATMLSIASEQATGYLCSTQALKPCAGKSSRGRTIKRPWNPSSTITFIIETRTDVHLLLLIGGLLLQGLPGSYYTVG